MSGPSMIDQIRNSSDLLALPQALSELLREMDKPDFSADQLANIILKDPALTGRILRMANSSFYNRLSEITTVHGAVQMLGVTTVKCLALSSSILHPEKIRAESGVEPNEYFMKVLTVAAAAEKIAARVEPEATEEAFIAGLLHDVGTMLFLYHYPDKYSKVVKKIEQGRDILEAEVDVFGVDHCDAGYHLATKWRLPEFICAAVRDHHTVGDPKDKQITNIIRLASIISPDSCGSNSSDIDQWLAEVMHMASCLSLSKDDIDTISGSLLSWTASVADYLGIDIGGHEEILIRANQQIWQAYLMVENLFRERQELNRRLLDEERTRGAVESKNVALSTLSHYLNNAAMAIYGRSQLMRISLGRGETKRVTEDLPAALDVIDSSIKKIVAVLHEIKDISPMDEVQYLNSSKAMDLDARIAKRLVRMEDSSGLVMPAEAEEYAGD
ncbi:MAG: HDOD domain-containing protein [Candidatus Zixiibacteriota bacterium]|nr:MAG: HDOD domain-containing protein [candidate division Zixibacteria bacterium]